MSKKATRPAWVTREETEYVSLKSNYYTRLIVGADKTPSGNCYEFAPGEVRDDIAPADKGYLLSLVQKQTSCCGGSEPQPIQVFTEV